MRRFVTLAVLLLFTVPFGISISGCSKSAPLVYCNGQDFGPVVGQVDKITLTPQIYGVSLNYAEIGSVGTPQATDCKGSTVSVTAYTYGTVDANGKPNMTIADVQPTTGRVCAGTWNRNTGGGIPDYTTCNPNDITGTAYVVVSAKGASSNPLPIYVHPVVTSVVLGPLSTDCTNDPSTNCSPAAFINLQTTCTLTTNGNGCCAAPPVTATTTSTGCFSQGVTTQLAARVYAGTGTAQTNISCQIGHLTYAAQTSSVVSIDQNGVATALQPGSTTINSNVSLAGSSAGFFSTCPPASITLSVPNGGTSVSVNPNNTQPITATVTDTNGVTLTGLSLSFVSTTPTTIPAATGSVTPLFPGAAAITAICQPPTCNPAPFNQIGLFGNGKPVASNPIDVTAPGINSTVLFMASTQSLYIVPIDFTTNAIGAPVRLPFAPNSMVISNDGSTIYMGSANEIMTFSTLSNAVTNQDVSVTGNVLAVSPDNTTLIITDPIRKLVYLYTATGGVQSTYGGVATHAEFTPDNSTVYITMGDVDSSGNVTPNNQLLVHSTFTGWFTATAAQPTSDIAVTVPSVGAFFGGAPTTARGYCPVTTVNGQETTNVFYPDAGVTGPATDRIAATNDGLHLLGASAASSAGTFTDLQIGTSSSPGVPVGACPVAGLTFTTNPLLADVPLAGVTATAITGVIPSSDSKAAFVTYTGSGGVLPLYTPAPNTAGTLGSVALIKNAAGTPVAPVAGVFSSDNSTFYVGTSGDNVVHLITKGTSGFQDGLVAPIAPNLPAIDGGNATPNLLVQKPRKAIS